MINLMIVEDNSIVRKGLTKFLSREKDINIVAESVNASAAITHLQEGIPADVLMADWNMPDMDGLELTTRLNTEFPFVKVIILTMHDKQEYIDKARAA